jgi:hypothetical protein
VRVAWTSRPSEEVASSMLADWRPLPGMCATRVPRLQIQNAAERSSRAIPLLAGKLPCVSVSHT